MPYLAHTPYVCPPFAEVEITVRGEMNEKFKAEGSEICHKVG